MVRDELHKMPLIQQIESVIETQGSPSPPCTLCVLNHSPSQSWARGFWRICPVWGDQEIQVCTLYSPTHREVQPLYNHLGRRTPAGLYSPPKGGPQTYSSTEAGRWVRTPDVLLSRVCPEWNVRTHQNSRRSHERPPGDTCHLVPWTRRPRPRRDQYCSWTSGPP